MTPDLQIHRFAYHYIDQKAPAPVYTSTAQEVDRLPPAIRAFLLDLVAEIWDAPDAGSTRSARFVTAAEPETEEPEEAEAEDAIPPSQVRPHLDAIRDDEGGTMGFFAASKTLADLLHQSSHPNASPGVLGVLRVVRPEDDAVFVALLKIRYRDEEFVRLMTGDLPRLEVEQVEKILLKEIQKGALIPHPQKPSYEVKVIDAQTRDDPAAYFTAKFLGCDSKKSDDLQIKKLAPFLERFAEEKDLPLAMERVAHVFQELRGKQENISAPVLAEAVANQDLFGEEFKEEEFEEFLTENELGELDIPAEEFQHNRRSSRRLVYRFIDPDYEGLEISGPPEAFARVMSSQNGAVTFTITVTPDGFRFNYQ